MHCKTITDRLKLFQNYLQGTDAGFNYLWINCGVTDTDLAFLIPKLIIGYSFLLPATPPESQKPIRDVCNPVCN